MSSSRFRHLVVEEAEFHIDFREASKKRLDFRVELGVVVRRALETRPLELNAVNFSDFRVEGATVERWEYDGVHARLWFQEPLAEGQHHWVTVRYVLDRPIAGVNFLEDGTVVTDLESSFGRYVWPLIDAPDCKLTNIEFHLRAHKALTRLATGKLIRHVPHAEDDTVTSIWRQERPIPSYLMAFVVGSLTLVEEGTFQGMATALYSQERISKKTMELTFASTENILVWMTKKLGPLPLAKYCQVAVKVSSAMENESLITYSDSYLCWNKVDLEERGWNARRVICHETSHTYFGNTAVLSTFQHLWLKEAFATFLPHVYQYETSATSDEGDLLYLYDIYRYVLVHHPKTPTCKPDFAHPDDLYNADAYAGAALRLYVLKNQVGEDIFWKGVQAYLQQFSGPRTADTSDFKKVMENVCCQRLDSFFDQWIWSADYPKLRITVDEARRTVDFEQVQERSLTFDLPLKIGSSSFVVHFDSKQAILQLPADVGTDSFIIDPEDTRGILYEIDAAGSSIPTDWLRNTLALPSAPLMAKKEAFLLLTHDSSVTREDLVMMYSAEPKSSVRLGFTLACHNGHCSELLDYVFDSEKNKAVRAFATRLATGKNRTMLLKHLDSFGRETRDDAIKAISLAKNESDVGLFDAAATKGSYVALARLGKLDLLVSKAREHTARSQSVPDYLILAIGRCSGAEEFLKELLEWHVDTLGRVPSMLVDALVDNGLGHLLKGLYPRYVTESDWLSCGLDKSRPITSGKKKKASRATSSGKSSESSFATKLFGLQPFELCVGVTVGALLMYGLSRR